MIRPPSNWPAPGDGKHRLLTSVPGMAFQLMTGVTSTAPQVMTSVNRQDAGREVTSNPARFLFKFTPINDPFTGVCSDLPVVDPYSCVFLAPFGVFSTRFGRHLVDFCPKMDGFLVPVSDLS